VLGEQAFDGILRRMFLLRWVLVVWNDIGVIRELFVADRADVVCSTIFRFINFRISAVERSSLYPRGWCGSSTR